MKTADFELTESEAWEIVKPREILWLSRWERNECYIRYLVGKRVTFRLDGEAVATAKIDFIQTPEQLGEISDEHVSQEYVRAEYEHQSWERAKPSHVGFGAHRRMYETESGGWEFAFWETWEKQCEEISNLNQGMGTLQNLLLPSRASPFSGGGLDSPCARDSELLKDGVPHMIRPLERKIVATVIQWLGTNCGNCFLRDVQTKAGKSMLNSHG